MGRDIKEKFSFNFRVDTGSGFPNVTIESTANREEMKTLIASSVQEQMTGMYIHLEDINSNDNDIVDLLKEVVDEYGEDITETFGWVDLGYMNLYAEGKNKKILFRTGDQICVTKDQKNIEIIWNTMGAEDREEFKIEDIPNQLKSNFNFKDMEGELQITKAEYEDVVAVLNGEFYNYRLELFDKSEDLKVAARRWAEDHTSNEIEEAMTNLSRKVAIEIVESCYEDCETYRVFKNSTNNNGEMDVEGVSRAVYDGVWYYLGELASKKRTRELDEMEERE